MKPVILIWIKVCTQCHMKPVWEVRKLSSLMIAELRVEELAVIFLHFGFLKNVRFNGFLFVGWYSRVIYYFLGEAAQYTVHRRLFN